jgi:D-alanyl-D-alanine carboxypeptidase (penicillin-binding protein 5/6)
MRRLLTFWISILIAVTGTAGLFADPVSPQITAQSAILVDALTGHVIWEKGCHHRLAPASTTKMMTAIVAMEHASPDRIVTASKRATETPYTSMHLFEGEQLSLHDVLYAMLMRSANDAAVAVAENVGGSEESFIGMMNAKAHALGAVDTHFVNPNGLPDPQHYSSAYDLAIIARYALRFPLINEIVRTKRYRLTRTKNFQDLSVTSHNHFLWKYPGADGIKTGFTSEAGGCLAASATRGNWRLIAVVLKSKKASKDAIALLDYGYKNFKGVALAREETPVVNAPVSGGDVPTVALLPSGSLAAVLRKQASAKPETKVSVYRAAAPIRRGEKLGALTGYINGRSIGTVDLVAATDVHRTLGATILFVFRTLMEISILTIVGGIVYGRTITKSSRRRRRRIAKRGGNPHNVGTSSR